MMLLRGRRARPRRPPQHVRFSGWAIPLRALSEMALSASSSAAWGPIAKDGRREREMRVYPSRGDVTRLLLTSDSHFGSLFCVHRFPGGRFGVQEGDFVYLAKSTQLKVHRIRHVNTLLGNNSGLFWPTPVQVPVVNAKFAERRGIRGRARPKARARGHDCIVHEITKAN